MDFKEKARDIGKLHGTRQGNSVFDGNTTTETYRIVLKGIEDGDPMVLDAYREPSFSGEFADDYSEDDLQGDLDFVVEDEEDVNEFDGIVEDYLDAARTAFWDEIERVCRYQLSD